MRLLSYLLKKSPWPQRVLAISKLCAFDLLKEIQPNLLTDQKLDYKLKYMSNAYYEIVKEYKRQIAWEQHFLRVLRNLDIDYRMIKK